MNTKAGRVAIARLELPKPDADGEGAQEGSQGWTREYAAPSDPCIRAAA